MHDPFPVAIMMDAAFNEVLDCKYKLRDSFSLCTDRDTDVQTKSFYLHFEFLSYSNVS